MDRSNADRDRTRLLNSRYPSSDSLDGLNTPDVPLSPHVSGNRSSGEDENDKGMFQSATWGLSKTGFRGLSTKKMHYSLVLLGLLALVIGGHLLWPPAVKTRNVFVLPGVDPERGHDREHRWRKPEGFKIVGMVFYGRPKYVNVLDCYLKQNLAINGGMLDYVNFMANTEVEEDLQWLDALVATTESYKKVLVGSNHEFTSIWAKAVEENTMYIKIDDDIVYVHEDAIPRLVDTKLRHPEAHDVGANIINSPLTDFLHYHTEAVHAYLPEPAPPAEQATIKETWRASELPEWTGNAADDFDFGACTNDKPCQVGAVGGPTYHNHRWLPMKNTSANLMKTPIAKAQYEAFGNGLYKWAMAAQQQYSLFENLEKNQMGKYWFGNQEGIWNMQYGRYNLNFLAVWGHDVARRLPTDRDDERDMTVTIPWELKRPLLVDSHAIVSHFSFGPQKELIETDLLSRYRAYANEMVCTKDNQKMALGSLYKDM